MKALCANCGTALQFDRAMTGETVTCKICGALVSLVEARPAFAPPPEVGRSRHQCECGRWLEWDTAGKGDQGTCDLCGEPIPARRTDKPMPADSTAFEPKPAREYEEPSPIVRTPIGISTGPTNTGIRDASPQPVIGTIPQHVILAGINLPFKDLVRLYWFFLLAQFLVLLPFALMALLIYSATR